MYFAHAGHEHAEAASSNNSLPIILGVVGVLFVIGIAIYMLTKKRKPRDTKK